MGNKIKDFTDLVVWQEGHQLVLAIYKTTKNFPKEEVFSLISQMRRCVVSVTSNIAEGFSRKSYNDKIRFYFIARGSLTELENQLLISRDLSYIDAEEFDIINKKIVSVHKLLNGLIRKSNLLST